MVLPTVLVSLVMIIVVRHSILTCLIELPDMHINSIFCQVESLSAYRNKIQDLSEAEQFIVVVSFMEAFIVDTVLSNMLCTMSVDIHCTSVP